MPGELPLALAGQPGGAWTVISVGIARNLSGGIAQREASIANEKRRAGSDMSQHDNLIVHLDKAGMHFPTP
jgi:hypothetical protein